MSKLTWRKDAIALVGFIVIAVVFVLSFNQLLGLMLKTDSPLVVVISGSMEPTYYGSNRTENDLRKDMLIVQGVEPSAIEVGDVIIFNYINYTEEDIPIVHRVTRVYQDNVTGDYWFSTKGDNPNSNNGFAIPENGYQNLRIDELNIHESRVVGKIVGRIPYLGGIFNYFQSEQGRYVLIFGALGIFLIIVISGNVFKQGKDRDADEFESVVKSNNNDECLEESSIDNERKLQKSFKKFTKKVNKHRHFVIPGIMLFIIILVPIIDTVHASWGSDFGIIEVNYKEFYSASHILPGEINSTAIITHVTINNPGHWHQEFKKFVLQITDNASQIIGEGIWTATYNFEGEKTVSICAWIPSGLLIEGSAYSITATAHLNTKFGRYWTEHLTENFIF